MKGDRAYRTVRRCRSGSGAQAAQRERNGSKGKQVGCVPVPSVPRSYSQVRYER